MRLNKGFTLIELVIVILLIGIMSGIAVPRFEKRIELVELKTEKKFTYTIWELLETYASVQKTLTGIESPFDINASYLCIDPLYVTSGFG